ncbi:MAG: hypothetical protein K0B11_20055, partial [Mariniphaga sp.]|nr:hypothetical protein [Mariniphaga sp.]
MWTDQGFFMIFLLIFAGGFVNGTRILRQAQHKFNGCPSGNADLRRFLIKVVSGQSSEKNLLICSFSLPRFLAGSLPRFFVAAPGALKMGDPGLFLGGPASQDEVKCFMPKTSPPLVSGHAAPLKGEFVLLGFLFSVPRRFASSRPRFFVAAPGALKEWATRGYAQP